MPVSLSLQMQKYFLGLKTTTMSPMDNTWPAKPYGFLEGAHTQLRRIFHLWRVCYYL
jgi:myosin-1